MAETAKSGQAARPGGTEKPPSAGKGNSGRDRAGGDEVGAGTFVDSGAEAEDLTRGAPPKPVKRYSHAG